jgi:CTP:molybdopterin cytidylyltransferase MocA
VNDQRICAVIPAAGLGTRLGADVPKILLEIVGATTVWDLLHSSLSPWVEHIHVVVSPAAEMPFRRAAAGEIMRGTVSVGVQDKPTGMGAAVFDAAAFWAAYDSIVVVWGDQVNLSPTTVGKVVRAHTAGGGRGLTLPLVPMPDPYVEYEFADDVLVRVRMSREGDLCRSGGLSDVGLFCLGTSDLQSAWARYAAGAAPGATTGELNFLPFFPHLSQVDGQPVRVVPVQDPGEARGINTMEDLDFARQALSRCAT